MRPLKDCALLLSLCFWESPFQLPFLNPFKTQWEERSQPLPSHSWEDPGWFCARRFPPSEPCSGTLSFPHLTLWATRGQGCMSIAEFSRSVGRSSSVAGEWEKFGQARTGAWFKSKYEKVIQQKRDSEALVWPLHQNSSLENGVKESRVWAGRKGGFSSHGFLKEKERTWWEGHQG